MTYNPNIPQANDLISNSQAQLLINNSQANIAFGVDHTAFDVVADQGKHKKATLIKQTTDPVADAAGPIVYARDVVYAIGPTTKTEELLRQSTVDGSSVIALTSLFNLPITAASGSSFIPGIPTVVGPNLTTGAAVIKWGDCGTVTPAGTPVGFASAFPTACFQVFVTVTQAGSNSTRTVTVDPGTFARTGFTAYSSNNVNARYFAIGN